MEKNQQQCPNCGYCPTCGRSGYHFTPYYPLYPLYPSYPIWYTPTTVTGGVTTNLPNLNSVQS